MPYPFSRKDKFLSSLAVALLIAIGSDAGPADIFLQSSFPRPHIFLKYSLYNNGDAGWMKIPDTPGIKHKDGALSRYIRKERNSDLVIAIPDAENGKYKVRFFDEEDKFLFEIKQIRDSLLIVEKLNFQHAGVFQYELYKDNMLVERNTFSIKKD
ncbi:MAG TPA: hypothetical protein VF939_14415 [Puia sp.]